MFFFVVFRKIEIERGQAICAPGFLYVHPHTKFVGQVYVLTEKEGGRSKPFFPGYPPQALFQNNRRYWYNQSS